MKKNKPVQYLTEEYVEQTRHATPEQIIRSLEDQRKIFQTQTKEESTLISLRVSKNILEAFKNQCELEGLKYQSQIKKLMIQWLKEK